MTSSSLRVCDEHPTNARKVGASPDRDGVAYTVWAPTSRTVEVEIEVNQTVQRRVAMTRDSAGYFAGYDAHGRAGDSYRFRLDTGTSYPDPASRWQPHGVDGPSAVIDSAAYEWRHLNFRRPAFRDLVIYELHVGTFTAEGTFLGVIEKLPYLADLGVSALELMPVADFAGVWNWGYDGVCLYAPSRAYGHPDDLRALVDAAHGVGIAIILDVVYNHFGPSGNYLESFVGAYLDESMKTPWGGAIRYGSPQFHGLRHLVTANAGYWMDEFHIDGFRLDATHAIVDASDRHVLAEITESIHARGGYAIAEDDRNDVRLMQAFESGGFGFDAVWADDFHHTMRVAHTGEQESYLADYLGTVDELAATLRNGWFYHGQPLRARQTPRGTPCAEVPPQRFVHCISNHDQVGNHPFGKRLAELIPKEGYRAASALLCLTPYTPLIFMGQEWAAETPFLYFTDHEEELGRLISAGRREEFKEFAAFESGDEIEGLPDPQAVETFTASRLHWDDPRPPRQAGTLALYRACLTLRREEAAFRPSARSSWSVRVLSGGVCCLPLSGPDSEWLLLVHVQTARRGIVSAVPTPTDGGKWHMVLSTREQRFGGDGASGWNDVLQQGVFDLPELALLRAW